MLILGAAPDLRSDRLPLAPVDYVAQALVALVERGDPGAAYHLSNRSQTSIGAIMAAARRLGYAVESMPFAAWRGRYVGFFAETGFFPPLPKKQNGR